jgi:hypothetical protein
VIAELDEAAAPGPDPAYNPLVVATRFVLALTLASTSTLAGCGAATATTQAPRLAAPIRSAAPAPASAPADSEPSLTFSGPLAPTFDPPPDDPSAGRPSTAFTGTFVRNDLDAAWRLGAPTQASVALLVGKSGVTAQHAKLLLAAPARLRAMGIESKHCRLDRKTEGGLVLDCMEGMPHPVCTDRIHTARLEVGPDALVVVDDDVRYASTCGCYEES